MRTSGEYVYNGTLFRGMEAARRASIDLWLSGCGTYRCRPDGTVEELADEARAAQARGDWAFVGDYPPDDDEVRASIARVYAETT
jgi:hypothetical protein